MDSNGDMYNGSTIVNETDMQLTAGSAVQVNLGFQASGKSMAAIHAWPIGLR